MAWLEDWSMKYRISDLIARDGGQGTKGITTSVRSAEPPAAPSAIPDRLLSTKTLRLPSPHSVEPWHRAS